jgi:hypothetical protein
MLRHRIDLTESASACWLVFGQVPDVDGVGDKCCELEKDELLELGSDSGCYTGGCCYCCWTGIGASAGAASATVVLPSGC